MTSTAIRTKPAPIYNPYDKFTKPQFDAWIDDLTGTLRRALGHIDDGGREDSLVVSDESSIGHIDAEQASESSEVDGDIEDSFAELKARRASRKAKPAILEKVQDSFLVGGMVAMRSLLTLPRIQKMKGTGGRTSTG